MHFLFSMILVISPFSTNESISLDLKEVFYAAPVIYSLLLALSLFSFTLWGYSLVTLRTATLIPPHFMRTIRQLLLEKRYEAALENCGAASHFTAAIIANGIVSRKHGQQGIREAMETEGRRCGVILWQRLALINDVVVIAPMLGLLGTVIGLFYAFYDINHSPDTLASLFDGLGVAIGTTVAGLCVAILSMVFYATLKFRVIRLLNTLENETLSLGYLIEVQ